MAKPIRLTEEIKKECLEEFAKKLADTRMAGGTFKFEKAVKYDEKKECEVVYTSKAWYKTLMLIQENAKEVGWHGVCRRDEEDPAVFYVEDILVYPQKVTGTTINPDAVEYAAWMNQLDDDTFNNLRCHVHSHVNMGVTPSGTDQKFREDRLSQLSDDDFYVFQIMNKKGDISSAVYDFRNNIFYETSDVKTLVICDFDMKEWEIYKTVGELLMACNGGELQPILDLFESSGMRDFLTEAKDSVKEEKYSSWASYLGRELYAGKGTIVPSASKNSSKSGSEVRINGQKTCYNGSEEDEIAKYTEDEDDYDDYGDLLTDPFGYTDERGRFHGTGSYSDPCVGDCERCDNVQCAYNDAYYDNLSYYGGLRRGGWYNR